MNGTVTGCGRASEPGGRRGGRIRYKLGTAEFSIALSALYQLLLLDPKQGCAIPVRAAGVGALPPPDGHVGGQHPLLGGPGGVGVGGVFGRGHPDVQLRDEPPHPGQPPQRRPSKARPRRETQTPCRGPPRTAAKQEAPPVRMGQQLVIGPGTPPSPWEGEGEAGAAKAARGAPLFGGG